MKKNSIMALLLAFSVTASAQTIAEKIFSLMPELPSEVEMIRYQKETTAPPHMKVEVTQPELYINFLDALKEAKEKAKELMEQSGNTMLDKVKGSKVGETGLTVSEVQGMSESQLEQLAQSQAANKLSSLGLSMSDLAKLGDGEVSKEQAMALAAKIAANQKTTPKSSAAGQQQKAKYIQQLQALGQRELALMQKIQSQSEEAMKAGRELYKRDFKSRVDACEVTIKEAISEGALEEKYSDDQKAAVLAAEKKYHEALTKKWNVECEFYARFIPMWRNAFVSSMNLCKKDYLSLMNEKKQIYDALYAIGKEADYALGDAYPAQAAVLCLEQPEEIEEYADVLEEDEK